MAVQLRAVFLDIKIDFKPPKLPEQLLFLYLSKQTSQYFFQQSVARFAWVGAQRRFLLAYHGE